MACEAVNAAYAIFTSGSTGKPKTIIVEHLGLCTSVVGHGRAYGMDETSRVLQFSNYIFDISLSELFATLVLGGTICVPSDNQRLQGLDMFINEAQVNTAMLTASFSITLHPRDVPSLSLLIFVGEAPTKASLELWFGHARVINGFGPAEACIYCTYHTYQSATECPTTIGRGFNSACWIMEPGNCSSLAPIGCAGELVIHGHALARGYANDEARNKASFTDHVAWLPAPAGGDTRRFYKTGDLARYNPDGTIQYLGRMDTQVKVRGFRVELTGIEYSIKDALPRLSACRG